MFQQIELGQAKRTTEKLQIENRVLKRGRAADHKEVSNLRDSVERLSMKLRVSKEASIEPEEYARVVKRGVAMENRIRELERLYSEQLQLQLRQKVRADEGKESRTLGTQWTLAD